MKREFLKEAGLTDEQVDKVMAEHGKSVNDYKEKADKVETLESQIEDYKDQIKTRDEQLNTLNAKANGNADLTEEIEKLKADNEKTKTDYEAKLQAQTFDYTLERTLSAEKAKNTRAVKGLLNTEDLKLTDEGSIEGLDEQLKSLRESDPYLFEEAAPADAAPAKRTVVSGDLDGGASGEEASAFSSVFAEFKQ